MFASFPLEPTRILIADDQADVRAALRLLFEQEADLRVVGELSSAEASVAQIAALRPDVVLLDWELADALRLMITIREACPGAQIIALSSLPESEADALDSGVDGFSSKGDPAERLLDVICSLTVEPCL
jgi:DNA-binding NarL/FixJ family response regulator